MDEDDFDYDRDEEPCDHDGYEVDTLDWRCRCWRCGECWHATKAEVDSVIACQASYEEMERETS